MKKHLKSVPGILPDIAHGLNFRPRMLLAEDSAGYRRTYRASLTAAGFDVTVAKDGARMEHAIRRQKPYHVILSDTELPDENGDIVCRRLLDDGVIPQTTLLLGMSSDPENQVFWRGLAHHGGFYDKDHVFDIGRQVMSHYFNFWRQTSPLWSVRMPEINNAPPVSRSPSPARSGRAPCNRSPRKSKRHRRA